MSDTQLEETDDMNERFKGYYGNFCEGENNNLSNERKLFNIIREIHL